MYKKAVCIKCNDGKEKPVIRGLCQYHYRQDRAKAYVEKKKEAKPKEPTGEVKVFDEIWEERNKRCFVTEVLLGHKDFLKKAGVFHKLFHHVLGKGPYPAFRLYKKNIIMVSVEVHHNLETKAMSDLIAMDSRYLRVSLLKDELKQEYYAR